MIARSALAALAIALLAAPARGQDLTGASAGAGTPAVSNSGASPGASSDNSVEIPSLDLSVPDAPAFTILGITPNQITKPRSAVEIAAALGTAIGADGVLHAGAAIEVAPGFLAHVVTLKEYQQHWYYRWLHNAQVSLATAASPTASSAMGTSGGPSTDLSVGFRLTVYDAADPLMNGDLMKAYTDAFASKGRQPPPRPDEASGAGEVTDLPQDLQAKVDAARKAAANTAWNATSVQLAGAYLWTSNDSSLRGLSHKGYGAWATGGKSLGSWGQLLGMTRVIKDTTSATDPGTTVVAGGRFIVGGKRWGASIEAAYNHLSAQAPVANDAWGQATAAFELGLSQGSWLEVAFGDTFDRSGQNDRFFSLANLKWSLGSKRVLLGQ